MRRSVGGCSSVAVRTFAESACGRPIVVRHAFTRISELTGGVYIDTELLMTGPLLARIGGGACTSGCDVGGTPAVTLAFSVMRAGASDVAATILCDFSVLDSLEPGQQTLWLRASVYPMPLVVQQMIVEDDMNVTLRSAVSASLLTQLVVAVLASEVSGGRVSAYRRTVLCAGVQLVAVSSGHRRAACGYPGARLGGRRGRRA